MRASTQSSSHFGRPTTSTKKLKTVSMSLRIRNSEIPSYFKDDFESNRIIDIMKNYLLF
jgi:hypothetical protein